VFLRRGNRKRAFSNFNRFVAILCVLVSSLVAAPVFADESTVNLAPINPRFEKYMDLVQAGRPPELITAEGYYLGFLPSPLDMTHTRGLRVISEIPKLGYPASYDLRTLGRLTPIKDQGDCGSCWAFATYASLESWFLGEGTLTPDFSENNLKNCHEFTYTGCEGGNRWMSTAYLARWDGPVNEASDPYHAYEEACTLGLEEKKHVETVLMTPDRASSTDNGNIKQAVMDYGAMYTSMYYDSSYYNGANYTYYYSGTDPSNHAVAIVGWDDDFDRTLFSPPYPAGSGAWIGRNNWGSGWGESGYFYISYYDSHIGKDNASFIDAEEPDHYSIYQYDPLGLVSSIGYGTSTAWGANIFTAITNENLTSVTFYALAVNTSYEVYVYDSFSGSSFLSLLGSKTGTLSYPGYHTIDLDSPIPLTIGNDFGVVVKFTTLGYDFPIPIEDSYPGYSDEATANAGESYVSSNGSFWTDITSSYSNTNVCIKAIATPPTISPDLTGLIVYPNPFEAAAGHSYVTFEALTEEVTIQIFTVSGQLVRKEEISGQYSWDWDLKNTDGEKVVRGVYIWMATNPAGEKRTGKIAIIQ